MGVSSDLDPVAVMRPCKDNDAEEGPASGGRAAESRQTCPKAIGDQPSHRSFSTTAHHQGEERCLKTLNAC